MRFYKLKDGKVVFMKSICTNVQARDHKDTIVTSVTTKLADYPDYRMKLHREKQLIKVGRELPSAPYERLSELAWGEAKCLKTGKMIGVADFGSKVHTSIERGLNAIKEKRVCDVTQDSYASHSQGFIDYVVKNKVQVMLTEHAIGCEKLLIAATADFIGIMNDKICLWDFKCRGGVSPLNTRAYDKDCMQLSVTALMVKEQTGLAYMPRIYTVPIDRDTGKTYVKCWTEKKQAKSLARFLKFNDWYNCHHFGIGENDYE